MKFQSPSTPKVQHDESNLLVEFLMLNKYSVIQEYAWRKGQPLAKEWGAACKVVRRLLKVLKIAPERLGWYIRRHQVTELNYAEFGLVKWKIEKWFPFGNLTKTAESYKVDLEHSRSNLNHDRNVGGVVYKMKERGLGKNRRKTLAEVIQELENVEK